MTLLRALAGRYDLLAETGQVPIIGFAPAQISFAIVLNDQGEVVSVDDLRSGKKRIPASISAPQAPSDRRGEKIVSGMFWDTSEYALGIFKSKVQTEFLSAKQIRKTFEKHEFFKKKHIAALTGSKDAECVSLLIFLQRWNPNDLSELGDKASDIAGTNVTFRLDYRNNYIFLSAGAIDVLERDALGAKRDIGVCLVTGEERPIARLHPPIKGLGDKLAPFISFNETAFESYGKSKGFNAPVSELVAFKYATALNTLISARFGTDEKGRPKWSNRVSFGDDTVVFWAETEPAEALARSMLEPPPPDETTETEEVRARLEAIERGEALENAVPGVQASTRVYILGLSPNAARVSVRFWVDQSLGDLARHVRQHWLDLDLSPAARGGRPSLWALLYEIAPLRKIDKGIQHLAGEMARSILSGGLYPASLLTQALIRARVEKKKTTPNRVALIKAVLARHDRAAAEEARARRPEFPPWKDKLVALDRDEVNIGYRLGRLFAVLEAAQYAGLGPVNATVKDKYFGAASATPGHIFPLLLRGAQDHLSTARKKGKRGRAFRLENEISQIAGGIGAEHAFPATLSREDQGRFVIGFYHQDADLRVPRAKGEEAEMPATESEIEAPDTEDAA